MLFAFYIPARSSCSISMRSFYSAYPVSSSFPNNINNYNHPFNAEPYSATIKNDIIRKINILSPRYAWIIQLIYGSWGFILLCDLENHFHLKALWSIYYLKLALIWGFHRHLGSNCCCSHLEEDFFRVSSIRWRLRRTFFQSIFDFYKVLLAILWFFL